MSQPPDAVERRRVTVRAYRALFGSAAGKRVLADMLNETGLLAVSHAAGDSHETAFNEGRRSIGLHLLRRMGQDLEDLQRLAGLRTDLAEQTTGVEAASGGIDPEDGDA